VFSDEGAYLWSTPCQSGSEVSVAGYVSMFVLTSEPACLQIMESSAHGGRQVWDCEDPPGSDEWCVLSHGIINGGVCPDGDCEQVPVEDQSWGAIKALYR
jgi:hypothetical protein